MFLNVDPIVCIGQIYFHPSFDDYVIITKADNGLVNFFGTRNNDDAELPINERRHFYGKMDSGDFVSLFPAAGADEIISMPAAISKFLLEQCPIGTNLTEGFLVTDDMLVEDEDEEDTEDI